MTSNWEIPVDPGLDNSLSLLKEGFNYIPNRCKRYNTDIFKTHLLGQKVICISGKEAAEVFYDNERFQRHGAVPKRIQKTLFGENGVQTLDGTAHEHRKQLFMNLMTPAAIESICDITKNQWQLAIDKWAKMDKVVLFKETEEIMCRTACQWAGVPLWANELKQRTKELGALIDSFGAVGTRYWQGRMARKRVETWIREIIRLVRYGKLYAEEDTPLYEIAWHEDLDGNLLDSSVAAVELINILRPIVAIARYITFGALALHQYPETRKKLEMDEGDYGQMFVQEVRRFYPFGPFLGAKVRKDFTWNGHQFKEGTLVLLDIYGMNIDPDQWQNPKIFEPERFRDWDGSPFDFIPQGGDGYHKGHRCAGEWITVEVMKTSLEFLTKHITYDVPEQDLSYSLTRMPPIPKSRFVIENVRWK